MSTCSCTAYSCWASLHCAWACADLGHLLVDICKCTDCSFMGLLHCRWACASLSFRQVLAVKKILATVDEHWACAPSGYLLLYFCLWQLKAFSPECDNMCLLRVQVLQHFCSVNIFECMECGRTEDQLGSVEEPPLSWPAWIRCHRITVGYGRCEYGGIRAVCQGIIGGHLYTPSPLSPSTQCGTVWTTLEDYGVASDLWQGRRWWGGGWIGN